MNIYSIFLLLVAVLFLYLVIRNINKNNFRLADAGLWIVTGFVLVLFSIFDRIPGFLADLFGFQVTSNFLLYLSVIFLLAVGIMHSIQVSKQKSQITLLIQELSLLKSQQAHKGDQDEQ